MKAISTINTQHSVTTIGFARRGYSTTGGAEAYLKRLAEGLLAQGYRVVLLGSGEWPQEAWPGGEVVTLPNHVLRVFAKEVLEYKKRGRIDLLFSLERVPGCDIFRAGDGVHAAWLERRKKREPAWMRWLSNWRPRHREVLALEQELFSPHSSTRVIANSAMVAREISSRFLFPESQLEIIPNGIPRVEPLSVEERLAARESFGMKEGELNLLFVGSGWKRKGVDVAIQAVEKITPQTRLSKTRLWVAGKGSIQNHNSQLLHHDEHEISGLVHFLGPVKKTELLYGAADLFILPTLYDPFSNASLEALAAGLPVITTAANGCSEVIEDGVHGSVIQDPNDIDAFASAILFWRKRLQSEDAPAIREACRERGSTFDMEKNLTRTIEVIERVLKNRKMDLAPLGHTRHE